jgi:hypothetical protein
MRWLAAAAALGCVSCTYYASHKILTLGEEPEQAIPYQKDFEQVDLELRPGPQEFPYVEGAGKVVMAMVKVVTREVPSRVTLVANGHNAEVGDITILAKYGGGPLNNRAQYSDVVVREMNRKQVASDSGQTLFELRGLHNRQPEPPRWIEVWFKVITHYKNSSDATTVDVHFNGASVGSYSVSYGDVAPK